MNIFVGNLNFKTTEQELGDLFSGYGNVQSVQIITDKFSGRSKGFAFVEMPDKEEAEKAIEGLNNYSLGDRNIVVNEARPKERSGDFKRKRY
ncbi:MAG: RNA-binding protein [Bacteroidia bacterium]|nr:RNA-binding protein [Bacteroidia bacterium]MCZ2278503.1 RNA-binding protein [Bacteroidia bacterium]